MIATTIYNRVRAVEYAKRWALSRNPLFYDFTGGGGNCTNFVSQAVLAGSLVMNPSEIFGWYYRDLNDRAPAWTGVSFFWQFMTAAPRFVSAGGDTGPFGEEVTDASELMVGDVVQLANEQGEFYHTLLVSGKRDGALLMAAHSIDAFDRPLSEYRYATARYLHILGVRVRANLPDCYPALLAGEALPRER